MLFATLDPTLRAVDLPHGTKIILSDTVGFISDLPTMLVAAFRATLEEVVEADVILHVRDFSHADAEAQARDVEEVLRALDIDAEDCSRIIEVWNKIDLLDEVSRARLANVVERQAADEKAVLVSAATGEGIEKLIAEIEARLARRRLVLDLVVDPSDGAAISWLHRNAEVIGRELRQDGRLDVHVRVAPDKAAAVRRKFS